MKVTDEERRARLGVRHRLAGEARADDVVGLVRDMVALHATDPASVYLSAAARLRQPDLTRVEAAMYEERTLVRLLAMRRTMFVFPSDQVALVDAAFGPELARRERQRLLQVLAAADVGGDLPAWLARVEAATVEALHARGSASGRELSAAVPELRTKYVYGVGKAYESTQTITSRLLSLLSVEGRIVRGRPSGTWASGQYRWSAMDSWLPQDGRQELTAEEARRRLIAAWLRAFGPATPADIKWWTGLTMGQVREALATLGPTEVELDGGDGLLLPDDLEQPPAPDPWVALLPALDPTAMGWTERSWYLSDEARAALFDRNGNVGPTVWCDGRIVGGWGQRKGGAHDGQIVYRLLEDIGAEPSTSVAEAAGRLEVLHGDVRVLPRFRTPLERALTA